MCSLKSCCVLPALLLSLQGSLLGCGTEEEGDYASTGNSAGGSGAAAGTSGNSAGGNAGAASAECMPIAQGDTASISESFDTATWGVQLPEFSQILAMTGGVAGLYVVATATAGDFLGKPIAEATAPLVTRGVLALFDLSGELAWALPIATSNASGGLGEFQLSMQDNGSAVLLVTAEGSVQFGSEPTLETESEKQLVLVSVDAAGSVSWTKTLLAEVDESTAGPALMSVDAAGIGLVFDNPGEYAGQTFDCDQLLARLTSAGDDTFARCVASVRGSGRATSLATTPDGSSHLAGIPTDAPDFGIGPVSIDPSAGSGFLVTIDGAGETKWQSAFLRSYARELLPLANGDVLVAGDMPQQNDANGLIEIAGASYQPCAPQLHLTRFDASGSPLWSRAYGDTTTSFGSVNAADQVAFVSQLTNMTPFAHGIDPRASLYAFGAVDASDQGRVLWLHSGYFPMAIVAEPSSNEWYLAVQLDGVVTLPSGAIGPGPALLKLAP